MKDTLTLPCELDAMDPPWHLTDAERLMQALEAHNVPWVYYLRSLNRLLCATRVLQKWNDRSELPEQVAEDPFFIDRCSDMMPTFTDVQRTSVLRVLAHYDIEDPSDAVVDASVRSWLRATVRANIRATLRAAEMVLVGGKEDEDASEALLDIIGRYLQSLDTVVAEDLVRLAAGATRTEALSFLRTLEADESLDARVRNAAQRYRAWIEQNFVED